MINLWKRTSGKEFNMYCRFCGKQILDDSEFCSFCGKQLSGETEYPNLGVKDHTMATDDVQRLRHTDSEYYQMAQKTSSYTLESYTKKICYTSFVIFLILYIKMAPGVGDTKFFTYIGGAAIAIGLTVLFMKISDRSSSALFYKVSLCIGIVVILLSVGLRIIYETKVDTVLKDFSPERTIYVEVSAKEELYSGHYQQMKESFTTVTIDGITYDNGDVAKVKVNQRNTAEISSGYEDLNHHDICESVKVPVTFSEENLSTPYLFKKKIKLSFDTYSETEVTFTRICEFWEVIFY